MVRNATRTKQGREPDEGSYTEDETSNVLSPLGLRKVSRSRPNVSGSSVVKAIFLSQHLKRAISPIVQTSSLFPLSARVCASPFSRAPKPSRPFLAMPFLLDFILSHSLAISGAFVALYFILCALYQLCFSPLCDILGPWYTTISDFWLTTHVLRLQQCRTIDALLSTL
jgi:hypothetical protein